MCQNYSVLRKIEQCKGGQELQGEDIVLNWVVSLTEKAEFSHVFCDPCNSSPYYVIMLILKLRIVFQES